jgi:large-conductance mechanosensitive channel
MGLMKEFKEFAVKGNALDMAVGIIIGAIPLAMPVTHFELNPVLLRVNTGGTFFMLVFLTLLF